MPDTAVLRVPNKLIEGVLCVGSFGVPGHSTDDATLHGKE